MMSKYVFRVEYSGNFEISYFFFLMRYNKESKAKHEIIDYLSQYEGDILSIVEVKKWKLCKVEEYITDEEDSGNLLAVIDEEYLDEFLESIRWQTYSTIQEHLL